MKKLTFITALLIALTAAAFAQTTEFTYQGRLTDGGTSPNGTYDFEFRLYDANNNSLGTIRRSGVTVTNGAFTTTLDFGANPQQFNGAPRLLEIAVKPSGAANYTTLNPRQPLTSAPYAIRSREAGIAPTWEKRAVEYQQRYRALAPNGIDPEVFRNRGAYGEYYSWQAKVEDGY